MGVSLFWMDILAENVPSATQCDSAPRKSAKSGPVRQLNVWVLAFAANWPDSSVATAQLRASVVVSIQWSHCGAHWRLERAGFLANSSRDTD
jgi:hypothetical protein